MMWKVLGLNYLELRKRLPTQINVFSWSIIDYRHFVYYWELGTKCITR